MLHTDNARYCIQIAVIPCPPTEHHVNNLNLSVVSVLPGRLLKLLIRVGV